MKYTILKRACYLLAFMLSSIISWSQSGAALNFDGVNDRITGTNASLPQGSGPRTIEAWIRPTTNIDFQAVYNYGTFLTNLRSGILLKNDHLYYVAEHNDFDATLATVPLNQWSHVAVTLEGTSVQFYVNGILKQSGSLAGLSNTTGSTWAISNTNTVASIREPFKGSIDEIRVWNRVLCQAEIQNNMNCELGITDQTGLVALYHFNQGTSGANNAGITTLTDATGNGNGTLLNLALSGSTSNWTAPGAVTTGTSCSVFAGADVPVLNASSTSNCGTQNTTLNIASGNLNHAANWKWYSGSCGGSLAGTGTSITVSPATTTTYYVRGEGPCITPGSCANITINVKQPSSNTINETACVSYAYNGTTYTATGSYQHSFTNAAGCDSVVTLNLTINEPSVFTLNEIACVSYVYNGTTYTTSGSYQHTFTNAAGCDSVVTLNLTINESSAFTLNEIACVSYAYNGSTYTASGSYQHSFTNAAGCDSVVTLHLTINGNGLTQQSVSPTAQSFCVSGTSNISVGASQTLANYYLKNSAESIVAGPIAGNGNNLSFSTGIITATDTFTVEARNRSIGLDFDGNDDYVASSTFNAAITQKTFSAWVKLNNINQQGGAVVSLQTTNAAVFDAIVYNETNNGWGFGSNNHTRTAWSNIKETSTNDWVHVAATYDNNSYKLYRNGILILTASSFPANTFSAGSSQVLIGKRHTAPGIPVLNAIIDEVKVWNHIRTQAQIQADMHACATGSESGLGLYYKFENGSGTVVTDISASGFNGTLINMQPNSDWVFGMDDCPALCPLEMIQKTIVSINQPTSNTINQTACVSYTYNGTTYTVSGSYLHHFTNAAGCDSVVTFNLTINEPSAFTLNEIACVSYVYNGTTYTVSGSYQHNFTNAAGCDSVVTLNLTINEPSAFTLTETACVSYTYNGTTYTTSGSYQHTFTNAAGCDSVVTLNLTINESSAFTLNEIACVSYVYNGTTYTVSGSYLHHFTNAAGCDSVVTLNLTINESSAFTLTETACVSYTYNGTTYTTSGSYQHTFTNAAGCDSVVTLNLTINQPSTFTLNESACVSYVYNGTTYTATGSYQHSFTNAAGCDSVVTLHLTINGNGLTQQSVSPTAQSFCVSGTSNISVGASQTLANYYLKNSAESVVAGPIAGNGNNLSFSTGIITATDTFTVEARNRSIGLDFDGNDDYVASSTFNAAITQKTFSAWVKLNNINQQGGAVVSLQTTNAAVFDAIVYNETNNGWGFGSNNHTRTAWSNIKETSTNDWVHVAATYDNNSYKLYRNGILILTASSFPANTFSAGSSQVLIGKRHTAPGIPVLNAIIDEVKVWNHIRTQAQIQADMHACATGSESGLGLYYKFENGSGTVVTDISASGFNGTLINMQPNSDWVFGMDDCPALCPLEMIQKTIVSINQPTSNTINQAACVSYTYNGTAYTSSGSYQHHFTNAAGCDSVVTFNLTINEPSVFTLNEIACVSYVYNGTTYTVSGSYQHSFTNAAGCDSVVTLNLTINQPSTFTLNESACVSYVYNGTTYTASGSYQHHFTNATGCDSVVALNLQLDTIPPIAVCKNIAVSLNASGTVSITASQVDNGSSDACGIASMTVSPSSFTCSNAGANTVALTVTDVNGNTSTCSSTITVEDTIVPTAVCQNITAQLDANGTATIAAAQVDNGSSDNCGIAGYTLSQTSFDCADMNLQSCSNRALQFDGVNDYAISVSPVSHTTAFTYETWALATNAGQFKGLVTTETPGVQDTHLVQLSLSSSGKLLGEIKGSGANNSRKIYEGSTVIQGSWHHLAITYDGSNFKLYVDGVQEAVTKEDDDAVGPLNVNRKIILGAERNLGNFGFTNARMDEVRVWNTARTQAQIQATMNSCLSGSEPGLIGYWPLENNPGSSVATGLIASNHATLTNMNINTAWQTGAPTAKTNSPVVVTLTVTDAKGNTGSCNANVLVTDAVPPVINCSAQTISTLPGACTANFTSVTPPLVTDNCSIINLAHNAPATLPKGNTAILWTATDASGNVAQCTQIVTVADNEAPVINCPANITVNAAAGSCSKVVSFTVSATDNCPGSIQYTYSQDPGTSFPVGVTTITVTASDASNNISASCSFTVTVVDNTPPTAVCQNIAVELDANHSYTLNAADLNNGSSDACGNLSYSIVSGQSAYSCSDAGMQYPVTIMVTDGNGNSSTCTAHVTVHDNTNPCCTPPVIICPASVAVNAVPGGCGTAVNFTATATGTTPAITYSHNPGNIFPAGITTVTAIATNSCGSDTCSFTVAVNDTQAPTAVCQNITAQLDANGTTTITAAQVDNGSSDNCGIAGYALSKTSFDCSDVHTQSCSNYALQFDGVDDYAISANPVSHTTAFTYETWALAINTGQFKGLVTTSTIGGGDSHLVQLSLSANGKLLGEIKGPGGNANRKIYEGATVIQGSWHHLAITYDGINFKLYVDGAEETVTKSDDKTVGALNVNRKIILGAERSLSGFGFTNARMDEVRVWNVARTQAQIQATMNTCLTGTELGLTGYWPLENGTGSGIANGLVAANHAALTNMNVNTAWQSGAPTAIIHSPVPVTLTVTDAHGNTSSCNANVLVTDPVPPVITCSNQTIPTNPGACTASFTSVTPPLVTDNCSVLALSHNGPATLPKGNTTIVWTATDASGNVAQCTQIVTVIDFTIPSVTISAPATAICAGSLVTFTATPTFGGSNPSYQWKVNGVNKGTNSPVFSSNQLTNGQVVACVMTASQACSTTATTTSNPLLITLLGVPLKPGAITQTSGKLKLCPGDTASFSINPVAGALGYTWYPPGGGIIVSGQGTTGVTIAFTPGFSSSNLAVTSFNQCAVSQLTNKMINRDAVPNVSSISGLSSVPCSASGVAYNVNSIADAVFIWSFNNSAAIITSGQGTNAILVDYTSGVNSQSLSVTASTGCGISGQKKKVIKYIPENPGVITGPSIVCPNQQNVSYSIAPLPSVASYTWYAPAGAIISGGVNSGLGSLVTASASVTVNFGTKSGVVKVKSNDCSSGATSNLNVTVTAKCSMAKIPESATENYVELYPNPARNFLNIGFYSREDSRYIIRIYDATGKAVATENGTSLQGQNQVSLSLGGFATGVYQLILENESKIEKARFIVE